MEVEIFSAGSFANGSQCLIKTEGRKVPCMVFPQPTNRFSGRTACDQKRSHWYLLLPSRMTGSGLTLAKIILAGRPAQAEAL